MEGSFEVSEHKLPDNEGCEASAPSVPTVPSASVKAVSTPPKQSPIRAPAQRSPTLNPLEWLRTVVSPLQPGPSSNLLKSFERCQRPNIDKELSGRVTEVSNVIFGSPEVVQLVGGSENNASSLEARLEETVKLYYHILESMCRTESQRSQKASLTALLVNERFQKSILACCAELILVANGLNSLFPTVLTIVGVCAFDFGKVIESVVRSDEKLPSELKRHLNSCEEKILESLSWKPGSSLYATLASAKRSLLTEILRMGLLPGVASSASGETSRKVVSGLSLNPSLKLPSQGPPAVKQPPEEQKPAPSFQSPPPERASAHSAHFTSPGRTDTSVQSYLHSAFASPQRPVGSGGVETYAEVQIKVFFRKLLKLSAMRIKLLCERLSQPSSLQEQIYWLVAHVVQEATALLFNRHLDQIVLASVYGVCKVSHGDVTFKKIITCYLEQPGSAPEVFRRVFLSQSQSSPGEQVENSFCDIIRFYNDVFVPATKTYLLQITSSSQQSSPAKTGESPFKSLPHMSAKRVSASHNVYVSPLRVSKTESFMSPRSLQLFTCPGDSATPYSSPSKELEAINNRLCGTRRLGRLDFSDSGNEAPGTSARQSTDVGSPAGNPSPPTTATRQVASTGTLQKTHKASSPSPLKKQRMDR